MEDQRELQLISARTRKLERGQTEVVITTSNGNIRGILHLANGGGGVIWVCGALGGLDGPSFGIFRTLSEELVNEGLTSFRLDYRFPGDLEPCITDVVVGAYYLSELDVERVALVGHSFGGVVVIQAGIASAPVKAVVGLSSQTYGATGVERLARNRSCSSTGNATETCRWTVPALSTSGPESQRNWWYTGTTATSCVSATTSYESCSRSGW